MCLIDSYVLKTYSAENIIIENNPEDFIEKAKKISSKNLDYIKIGLNAREHVTKNYDQKLISKQLISFFETAL